MCKSSIEFSSSRPFLGTSFPSSLRNPMRTVFISRVLLICKYSQCQSNRKQIERRSTEFLHFLLLPDFSMGKQKRSQTQKTQVKQQQQQKKAKAVKTNLKRVRDFVEQRPQQFFLSPLAVERTRSGQGRTIGQGLRRNREEMNVVFRCLFVFSSAEE